MDRRTGPIATTIAALGQRARTIMLVAAVFAAGLASASFLTADAANPTAPTGAQATPDIAATPQVLPPVVGTPEAANPCDALAPGTGAEAWVQTELYFGRGTDDTDGEITDEQWQGFLDTEVTPRFPDGLTVLDGYGQFLNASGVISQEDSTVLIILAPMDPSGETSAALDEIREAYKVAFDQESVLRTDTYPVCTAF